MVKISPSYRLKLPNGQIHTKQKYRSFCDLVRRDILPESIISVIYRKGLENSGTFSDYKTAASFLRECTEPALLQYIGEGKW